MTWTCDQKTDLDRWPGKWQKIATRKRFWNYDLSKDLELKKWPGIAIRKMTKNCDQKKRAEFVTCKNVLEWKLRPEKLSEIMTWKIIWDCDQENDDQKLGPEELVTWKMISKTIWNCDQKTDLKLWPKKWSGKATWKMMEHCDQKNVQKLWPEQWLGT